MPYKGKGKGSWKKKRGFKKKPFRKGKSYASKGGSNLFVPRPVRELKGICIPRTMMKTMVYKSCGTLNLVQNVGQTIGNLTHLFRSNSIWDPNEKITGTTFKNTSVTGYDFISKYYRKYLVYRSTLILKFISQSATGIIVSVTPTGGNGMNEFPQQTDMADIVSRANGCRYKLVAGTGKSSGVNTIICSADLPRLRQSSEERYRSDNLCNSVINGSPQLGTFFAVSVGDCRVGTPHTGGNVDVECFVTILYKTLFYDRIDLKDQLEGVDEGAYVEQEQDPDAEGYDPEVVGVGDALKQEQQVSQQTVVGSLPPVVRPLKVLQPLAPHAPRAK